jgi:two-component system, cell cycle response regulator DivK
MASPRVLIVDDDPGVRGLYDAYLTSVGCDVLTARDGAEAIEKAEAVMPDVIVMDLDMPHVDGWKATTSLKRSAQTRHIPVIAMSGISQQARRTAQRAGCDAFVAKPCLPDLLWWRIQAILRKGRR